MKPQNANWVVTIVAIAAMLPWIGGCQSGNRMPTSIDQAESEPSRDLREAPSQPTIDRRVFAHSEAAPDKEGSEEREEGNGKQPESGDSDMDLSPEVREVIDLAESNATEAALMSQVTNAATSYDLTVDEILYLHDKGVPENVIEAMRASRTEPDTLRTADADSASLTNLQSQLRELAPSTNEIADAQAPSAATASESGDFPDDEPVIIEDQRFYQHLRPYGQWHQTEDYGACWQPSVALIRSSWRPYSDRGRWLYTDYGWYWQSDYPWGWITFHYGRWHDHPNRGWLWKPGDTWAPAWVSWRYGDPYCGWAPLPPGTYYRPNRGLYFRGRPLGEHHSLRITPRSYTFLRSDYLTHRRFHRFVASRHLSHTLFRLTRPYYRFESRGEGIVANHGADPETVAPGRDNRLRKVEVRDLPEAGEYVKPDHLERREGKLVVYRGTLENRPPPPTTALRRARTAERGAAQQRPESDRRGNRVRTASQARTPQRESEETPSQQLRQRLQRIVEETPNRQERRGERTWTTRQTHYPNRSLSPAGEGSDRRVVRESDPDRQRNNDDRAVRNVTRRRSLRQESDPARRTSVDRDSRRSNDRIRSTRPQDSPRRRSLSTRSSESSRSSSSVRSSRSRITSSSPTEAPSPTREASPDRRNRSSGSSRSSSSENNGNSSSSNSSSRSSTSSRSQSSNSSEPSEVQSAPVRGSDPARRR